MRFAVLANITLAAVAAAAPAASPAGPSDAAGHQDGKRGNIVNISATDTVKLLTGAVDDVAKTLGVKRHAAAKRGLGASATEVDATAALAASKRGVGSSGLELEVTDASAAVARKRHAIRAQGAKSKGKRQDGSVAQACADIDELLENPNLSEEEEDDLLDQAEDLGC